MYNIHALKIKSWRRSGAEYSELQTSLNNFWTSSKQILEGTFSLIPYCRKFPDSEECGGFAFEESWTKAPNGSIGALEVVLENEGAEVVAVLKFFIADA